jgi:hypothetical protein
LFGERLLGFYQRGTDGRRQFFDDVFGAGDQLRALLDELVGG